MVRYTAEEDAVIRIMYEDGKGFQDIADQLKRTKGSVAAHYKLILAALEKRLQKNIDDEIDYFEGDEYIPAKDWAARQKARVESTWDHEGLPPSSLYSEVPPWPESMPGSSDNLGGQEPTTSHAQNPQPPANSTDDETEEESVATLQKEVAELKRAHHSAFKSLKAEYAQVTARQKSLIDQLSQENEELVRKNAGQEKEIAALEKEIAAYERDLEKANGRNVEASAMLLDLRKKTGALDRATNAASDLLLGIKRPETN